MGWSMKKMLECSFQPYGLNVAFSGVDTRQGPGIVSPASNNDSSVKRHHSDNLAHTQLHEQAN